MTTSLTTTGGRNDLSAYNDGAAFEHAQRVAKALSASSLVPKHLKESPSDVLVGYMLAREMGESPVVVLQSIYFVSGRAGFSATYMIGRANNSGIFKGRIGWDVEGKGDSLSVTARATLAETGERIDYTVTMAMAKDEGWTKNPKYRTMPELMLRYRSATALIRLYCPEVMLGYRSVDELEDMSAAGQLADERPVVALTDSPLASVLDAEEVEPVEVVAERDDLFGDDGGTP